MKQKQGYIATKETKAYTTEVIKGLNEIMDLDIKPKSTIDELRDLQKQIHDVWVRLQVAIDNYKDDNN